MKQSFTILLIFLSLVVYGQDNIVPVRTPDFFIPADLGGNEDVSIFCLKDDHYIAYVDFDSLDVCYCSIKDTVLNIVRFTAVFNNQKDGTWMGTYFHPDGFIKSKGLLTPSNVVIDSNNVFCEHPNGEDYLIYKVLYTRFDKTGKWIFNDGFPRGNFEKVEF